MQSDLPLSLLPRKWRPVRREGMPSRGCVSSLTFDEDAVDVDASADGWSVCVQLSSGAGAVVETDCNEQWINEWINGWREAVKECDKTYNTQTTAWKNLTMFRSKVAEECLEISFHLQTPQQRAISAKVQNFRAHQLNYWLLKEDILANICFLDEHWLMHKLGLCVEIWPLYQ